MGVTIGRRYLLVEVNENILRLGCMERNGRVTVCRRYELPAGTVTDGEITDAAIFMDHIKAFLSGTKIKYTAIMLHSTYAIVRFGIFPVMRESELEKVVTGSFESYFPLSKNKLCMSWKKIGVWADKVKVMMAAIPLAMAVEYVRFFDELNMEISYIDCFEGCLSELFGKNDDIIIVYQKKDRIALLYLPRSADAAIWDVSADEALGLFEMIKYYTYYVMRAADRKISAVHTICPCPVWVRAFFESEGINFIQYDKCDEDEHCLFFQSAILRLRGGRSV